MKNAFLVMYLLVVAGCQEEVVVDLSVGAEMTDYEKCSEKVKERKNGLSDKWE